MFLRRCVPWWMGCVSPLCRDDPKRIFREESERKDELSHSKPTAIARKVCLSVRRARCWHLQALYPAEDKQKIEAGYRVALTEWQSLPCGTDLLFYEGLYGGLVTQEYDIARHVDLLVGVAPTMNLEWIQKSTGTKRGYSQEAVIDTILGVWMTMCAISATVFVPISTSTGARSIRPTPDAGYSDRFGVVCGHPFRDLHRRFPWLLAMIKDSFMTRPHTLVVPGARMSLAMELILAPLVRPYCRSAVFNG